MDFDQDYYQDYITLGNEDKEKDYSVEDVTADNVENVTANDDEGRKNSVSMDDDVNNYGPIGDGQTVNSELMLNNEYRINKSVMGAVDKAKNMHDGGRRGGEIF